MQYVGNGDLTGLAALAACWIPRWRGSTSTVEELVSFYAPQGTYSDPQWPDGIVGHDRLREYFSELLEVRADWCWGRSEVVPVVHGFVSYWQAAIPLPRANVREVGGACLVHVRDGRIARHEVIFRRKRFPPPLALAFGREEPYGRNGRRDGVGA